MQFYMFKMECLKKTINDKKKNNDHNYNDDWSIGQKIYANIIKPIIDFMSAIIGLIFLSPLFLIIAIAIKLDSRGPVFFLQKRIGKDFKIFTLIKFRSMEVSKNLKVDSSRDMERVTRVGSFLRETSIDELPQLINILTGKMSFIGPRPLLVEYLPYYSIEQNKRHYIRQGITGYSQTNGRNSIKWERRFEMDIDYVKDISLWLDLKILIKTIINLLNRKGINDSVETTMPMFNGSNK
jgi:lipopolysaccharide/colanic/teichoic acid biosynthesis glycosyltransferase